MESGAGGGRPRSAEGAARRAAASSDPAAPARLEGRRCRRPGRGRFLGGVLQRVAGRVPHGAGSGKAAASPLREPRLSPAGRAGRAAGKGRGLAPEAGAALRVPGPAVVGRGGAACGRAGGRARLAPRPELRAQVVPQVMGGRGPLGSSRDQRCAP